MHAFDPPGEPEKKKLPRVCTAIYLLSAVSALLYGAFRLSVPFSDWFNETISTWGRRLLAYLTVPFPFSVAELFVILLPFFLVLLITVACRHYTDSARNAAVFIGILGSILGVIWILFVWNFAAGYSGSPLEEKLELDRREVSAVELHAAAERLAGEIGELEDDVCFPEDHVSVMPYSFDEMNRLLLEAYDRFCAEYDRMDNFYSRVKPVMLSEPMSYTHITGVYTFFTGEANINVNFPDYTIPYTAAHELAHQRGIAREDEANFIAFLICMESDDPYIRYSGLLSVYEYVASALASADPVLYRKAWEKLPVSVQEEEIAYSAFFEKYRKNVAAAVSNATNDTYLRSQGASAGTRSYNMVVDLTVAYFRKYPESGT